MDVNMYLNFNPDFYDKYATRAYYLSKGASGRVFGPIPSHEMQLAIKEVMFADGKVTDEFKKDLKAKRDIWASLEHKHLMKIHTTDLSQLPKVMFVVMEFAPGGSLDKTLRSLGYENKLPIDVVTDWSKQIAEGMLYLHEKDIVHRDLKPSNILLMEHFDVRNPDTGATLKITDFDEVKEHDRTASMSLVGTCAYMAPEVLNGQWFCKPSDVWSFGVVIWEMLSGDIPHKGLEPRIIMFKSQVGKLDNLPIGQSFPEDYKLLLNRCWKLKCSKRLSFHTLFRALQQIAERKDATEILKGQGNTSRESFLNIPEDEAHAYDEDVIHEHLLYDCYGYDDLRERQSKLRKESGLPQKYKSDPVLIKTIRTTDEEGKKKWIEGLTILDRELFVVRRSSSEIEVYDSIKLVFSRRFNLQDLHNPMDITSCSRNKCLYIFDSKYIEKSRTILRVDPNGKLIKKWSTTYGNGCGLSVTYESNVILTLKWNILNEYSSVGQLIREINLSDADIRFPWHAIKLTSGNVVVSHGFIQDLHRVCLVDVEGKLLKSFGGERGSNIKQMNCPAHLSVDGNGFVFVADEWNHRVLLLDSNLEFHREILRKGKHELQYPWRILLDELTNRAFVAERYSGLIKIFQI